MENGAFVEFPVGSSINTNYPTTLRWSDYSNNAYAYLIYDFLGYSYSATYYRTSTSSNPASGTQIWPVLRKINQNGTTNDNWRYCYASRTSWTESGAVTNNSHIYVIYTPKTITKGYTPSSEGDDPGTPVTPTFKPDVGKDVTNQKEDGTYDITLGFVGNKEDKETKTTARVIVVFDLSASMTENWSGQTRLARAKTAVLSLAEKLLGKKDSSGNPLVEMGLIKFGGKAEIVTFGSTNEQFTSSYNTGANNTRYYNAVNGLSTYSGQSYEGATNWEAALNLANSMQTSSTGKTYIVFVSDGDPTFRISRGSYTDSELSEEYGGREGMEFIRDSVFGYGSDSSTSINRCYDAAEISAKSIVDNNKILYTVGLTSETTRMEDLTAYAYGQDTAPDGYYFPGNEPQSFIDALDQIASSIENEIGLTDMTITDGVTSMSQIETQSLIGTAGNFTYHKSYPLITGDEGYTYSIGENSYSITQAQVNAGTDGTHKIFSRQENGVTVYYIEYPWEGANVPEATINENNAVVWDTSDANSELEHGVYYSVTFTVWPKQEAYDLIADLDNGIRKVTDSDLAAGTKAQLRVLVGVTTYEYDTASGTWTNGLTDAQLQALIDANDASFSMKTNTGLSATYKYGGVDSSSTYTNYTNGNMSLDDTSIKIKKTWNNYMDARYATDVTLTITRNGEDYTTFRMGTPVEVTTEDGKQWVQEPEDNLYISLGVLSVTGENIVVREAGYDYTVVEPQEFDYRWDLTADIYHPMVINGRTTVLVEIQDENAEDVPEAAKNLTENKTVTVDGVAYYNFNDHLYVTKTGENLLEATNDRRSNLIISKVVDENDALKDDLFPIQITIDDPNGHYPDDDDYSDYYDTIWFYISTASNDATTIVTEDVVIDGATAEERDGTPTGYYWFDNGGTATVSVKAGWFINIINLRKDTNYTIVEPTATIPDGYTFEKASFDYSNYTGEVPTTPEINDYTVNGSIDISNTEFKVKYDNKYEGFYYVYHSSNLDVYRFPMAVDGVKVTSFDIFGMTAKDTLYGGYYMDYAGKSIGYDSADLTYDENNKSKDSGEDAKAYSYQYIKDSNRNAWSINNAYDQDGTEAVPVKDTTYYLKEVPNSYMLPYTHYTYYKTGYKLANIWTITAVDDLNYTGAGFIVETEDREATIVESLKIKAANSSTTTTLTPEKLYKAKGILAGYLGYNDITEFMSEGTIIIKQYWTTPDGITIKGTTQRTLTFGDGTITGLKKTDSPCKD
nr:VWA domain-containing protein [Clostridia bacterium]